MGAAQSKGEKIAMFMFVQTLKKEPFMIKTDVLRAWYYQVKTQNVLSKYNLVETTEFVKGQLYYYISKCESRYVVFKKHISIDCHEFYMCNQQTFEKEQNHHMWFKPDNTGKIYKLIPKNRWVTLKCCVKLLSLHKRAVIIANHPLRKLARGEFNDM